MACTAISLRNPERNRQSLTLVARVAKSEDRIENEAEEREPQAEARTFTEPIRNGNRDQDRRNDVHQRDQQ